MLEKNKKLFDAAHRMFSSSKDSDDNDRIDKMYVDADFRRPETHLVGVLPPLSPKRLVHSRNYNDAKLTSYNGHKSTTTTAGFEPRQVKVDLDDDDEGYPATLNVATSRSTQNVVGNEMSSSHRDVSDPMSLDSGVITTLSR